jgi:hypothetical protein
MNAYVNGEKVIIYGFNQEGSCSFIDCYFPDLGYRMPVPESLVYIY